MKMKFLSAAILAAGLFSVTAAVQAATLDFSGSLINGQDVAQRSFVVDSTIGDGTVTLYTDPNLNRKFDTFLVVWDWNGNLVKWNDNFDPNVGLDSRIEFAAGGLADGVYSFTISNAPIAPLCYKDVTCNISQGFGDTGYIGGNPDDFRPGGWGAGPNDQWHVVVTGAVAAVPEPETWAMLLAGLGMVGAVARRRRQQ